MTQVSPALILVLNCGSSSIKFTILDACSEKIYLQGLAEAIGQQQAMLHYQFTGECKQQQSVVAQNFAQVMQVILQHIEQSSLANQLLAVGHRVVHGGERFVSAVKIDAAVMRDIADCIQLAPLHNPANLMGIEQAMKAFPKLAQVAVFDTSFHQTLPEKAYLYALPYQLYRQHQIRRYGFHGINHRYISLQAATMLHQPIENLNIISAHLGNGCSLAAIAGGKSVDTTMGLTPLDGLIMGSRCGSIDPSIPGILMTQQGLSVKAVDQLLNRQSGLLGISELSNDMRELSAAAEQGHHQAQLAIDMFCYQLSKQISALSVALPRLDALIFTGGIGENAIHIRQKVLKQLHHLGFIIDEQANQCLDDGGCISAEASPKALVIAANEEWMIAKDTLSLVRDS